MLLTGHLVDYIRVVQCEVKEVCGHCVQSVGVLDQEALDVMFLVCLFIDLVPDPCSFEPDSEVAQLAEQMKTLLENAEPTDDCIQLPTSRSDEAIQLEVSEALQAAGLKISDRVLVGGMKVLGSSLVLTYTQAFNGQCCLAVWYAAILWLTSIGQQSAIRVIQDKAPIRPLSFLIRSFGGMEHPTSAPSADDEH